MLIVQLSDIHVGSQFKPKTFAQVVNEVNKLKPDAILITGDLTNEGLINEYKECKKLVSKFKAKKTRYEENCSHYKTKYTKKN